MLVLSRRENEKIQVGDDIVITVIEITRGKVRIGIEAPMNTLILRTELIDREEERDDLIS